MDGVQTLAENLTGEKKELNLPSTLDSVDKAASEAAAFAQEFGFPDDALFAIDMAVREAVANAVKHGNKQDETKQVEITLVSLDEALEIVIRDFGEGFDASEVPDPTNPENLLKASGRGILFMHNFVDKVEWKRHPQGGMIVKMTKNH